MKSWVTTAIMATLLACTACASSNNGPAQETATPLFQRPPQYQGGTFTEGDWSYVLTIRNPGSRSEGSEGRLYYQGREIPRPVQLSDFYDTPLGIFRHTGVEAGQEQLPWDTTGWMRQSEDSPATEGKALPWPHPLQTER
ncbi:MAG: hypothetical protein AB7D06_14590 [Pedobacter sp.]